MEGIGFYILLLLLYVISAYIKKKQQAAARRQESMQKDDGQARKNEVPDLVRELFGLSTQDELEPVRQDVEEDVADYEEEIPWVGEPQDIEPGTPAEIDISELSYDDLETVSEEKLTRKEFVHDVDSFKEGRVPHSHSREESIMRHKILSRKRIHEFLSSRNDLRNAIVLSEILGRPKALSKNDRRI